MINKIQALAFFSAAFTLMAGCSNPADNVEPAQVTNAQPVQSDSPAPAGKLYVMAPESKINFTGSKVTGSHSGGFTNFTGQFTVADGKVVPGSVIEIDLNSLWADNNRLAGHLESPDFFDVEKFPKSTFTATGITPSPAGHTVTGNFDLHGVTKSITFPAKIEVADDEVRVKAQFFIKRFDFGIEYKGKADDLIRDEVVIELDVIAKPSDSA